MCVFFSFFFFPIISTLSSCMHAVVALLYPFSWQHTFIPVLPGSMLDIVCCPTPFLVGLLSSSLPKLKELPVEEVSTLSLHLFCVQFVSQTVNYTFLNDFSFIRNPDIPFCLFVLVFNQSLFLGIVDISILTHKLQQHRLRVISF